MSDNTREQIAFASAAGLDFSPPCDADDWPDDGERSCDDCGAYLSGGQWHFLGCQADPAEAPA